jgi:two-component system CheB/CheR fusion protein
MLENDSEDVPAADGDATEAAALATSPATYVVGVGASAGGLEALRELLGNIELGQMALVVVQHLSPDHDSLLAELLARTCPFAVEAATDGTVPQAKHVYVIPANADLALMQGVLRVLPRDGTNALHLPIDFLFRSLADELGPCAMGVVLSGTGSDGTAGLKAIRAAGGITFVQDPETAKYDSMPRSAMACADFCLDPRAIASELGRLGARPPIHRPPRAGVRLADPPNQATFARLLLLVRTEFGLDVTQYKPATLERRVERRMALHRLEELADYVRLVESDKGALQALHDDMLIGVTRFFRDPAAFEALRASIFPRVLDAGARRGPIRVWVPACATGEEAYSLAIALVEFLEERKSDVKVQIFATDVDDAAIRVARRGVYPEAIELDLSAERLRRFFTRVEGEYQICRRVRDMVVFSRQDVLQEPPFSRIDLVSCRNLLIYLEVAAQKRVLRTLHYALRPQGFLMLGTSETVGDCADLFTLEDRKNKLYVTKHGAALANIDMGRGATSLLPAPRSVPASRPQPNLQSLVDRKVLELYGPAGVVVNEALEIVHFRGQTGEYLNPMPGAASFGILRLARPELHMELKRALEASLSSHERTSGEVKYHRDGVSSTIALDIIPLHEPDGQTRRMLVLFRTLPSEAPTVAPETVPGSGLDPAAVQQAMRVRELERELEVTKEYLQVTLEERESANEELQAANEELQSSNEELQSTNEELETSKEELQSSIEELTTVNEELQNRMSELGQAHEDLHNVLAGVDHAVLIVGLDLRLRRYTMAAERLFNLVPGDVGRSVRYVSAFFHGVDLVALLTRVVRDLAPVEEEVLCSDGRWYALRIAPYQTVDHSIRGGVVSLADIDVRRRALGLARNVGEYASQFLQAISHPLLIIDAKQRVVWANEPYYEASQSVPEETVGSVLANLVGGWADTVIRERVQLALDGTPFRGQPVVCSPEWRSGPMTLSGNLIPVPTEANMALLSLESDPSRLEARTHEPR